MADHAHDWDLYGTDRRVRGRVREVFESLEVWLRADEIGFVPERALPVSTVPHLDCDQHGFRSHLGASHSLGGKREIRRRSGCVSHNGRLW